MDEKYIALIGGIVGSSFTIIVTKIFDYLQNSQAHKLALKKEFFLRKLNVFEKTVSYYTIVHTSMSSMALLLKTALNDNVTFTEELNKTTFERFDKNLQKINEATQEIAGSIDLYVDLKHDDTEIESTQQFWLLLGTITQLVQDVNLGYSMLSTISNINDYQKKEDEIDLKTKALESNTENFLALSNTMRSKYLGIASLLRQQLTTYQ